MGARARRWVFARAVSTRAPYTVLARRRCEVGSSCPTASRSADRNSMPSWPLPPCSGSRCRSSGVRRGAQGPQRERHLARDWLATPLRCTSGSPPRGRPSRLGSKGASRRRLSGGVNCSAAVTSCAAGDDSSRCLSLAPLVGNGNKKRTHIYKIVTISISGVDLQFSLDSFWSPT